MRIGLALNLLDEEYQISVYKGVIKRAAEFGIELICFQLEYNALAEDKLIPLFPRKEVFDIDGIIILTSVIVDNSNIVKKSDLEKIWGDIPVVSVGQKVKGVPSLLIKTDDSMKELVDHLVLEHKYKKFLFINGAKKHPDAINRQAVFKKAIESHKSSFPDLTYVCKEGNFTAVSAIQVMEQYMNEKKESPDVVVCANDNMALGVYKYFKMNRNDKNIQECAVTGFDDIPQARFEIPPLTTIHQPLDEIGQKSVELLKQMIECRHVEYEKYIGSRIVYRRSCGCCKDDDFYSKEDQFLKMQSNYFFSETMLRMVSHVGQEINCEETLGGLKYVLRNNMEQFNVNNFCMLRFSNGKKKKNIENHKSILVDPLYVRKNGVECYEFDREIKMSLGQFYRKYIGSEKKSNQSFIVKYLSVGNELIGCALYDADEKVLPYLSSIAINISHCLNRITVSEERKKRSEELEKEVNKRTKELVEANTKRMKVEAEVLKISEIERQRFSNDLHDDICQRLAGISMLCRSYSNQDSAVEKRQMIELAELIGETLSRVRQYAHNSYPVELEGLGINYALSNLCNTFENQSGIKCDYRWAVHKDVKFSKTEKLNTFRIIQEALHNVMKHSKAKNVTVSVFSEDKKISVSIIDDGIGFVNNSNEGRKGLGLNSMEYRANQIGAKFFINQNKPFGTCVLISWRAKNK